jgi:hypothetical protein
MSPALVLGAGDGYRGPDCRRRGALSDPVSAQAASGPVSFAVDLLAAVPSIIFGLWDLPSWDRSALPQPSG